MIYAVVRYTVSQYLQSGIVALFGPEAAGVAGRNAENNPRVEKPSKSDAILNLFRINTNYYSNSDSASAQAKPKEETTVKPPAEG